MAKRTKREIVELILALVILSTLTYLIIRALMQMKKTADNFDIQQSTIDFLKQQEGVRNDVYLDSVGIPTVGIGHVVLSEDNLNVGDSITDDQVLQFAKQDMAYAKNAIWEAITTPINQNMFDALLSLTYNIGTGALANSTVVKKINSKASNNDIEDAWSMWDKAGGISSPSLLARRQREFNLFISNF